MPCLVQASLTRIKKGYSRFLFIISRNVKNPAQNQGKMKGTKKNHIFFTPLNP